MREPNDLPNFLSEQEAVAQAKADFSLLLKSYTFNSTNTAKIKRESLLNSETYKLHANALQNAR